MKETDWHYVLKMTTPLNYETAEEYCEKTFDTSLGSVHSKEENDAIVQILKGFGGKYPDAWIGLRKDGNSKWNWVDNTGNDIMNSENCAYSKWMRSRGEPGKGDACARISNWGWAGSRLSLSLFIRKECHAFCFFRFM